MIRMRNCLLAVLLFVLVGCISFRGESSKEHQKENVTYCRPLYMEGDRYGEKASKVLSVELQNYTIKKDEPWQMMDYSLDTVLYRWYQNESSDTIRSVPSQFTSGLNGNLLVLIHGLSGTEKFAKNKNQTTYYRSHNGLLVGHTEPRNLAGEINKYKEFNFSSSVFDARGNLLFAYEGEAESLDKAVRRIFRLPAMRYEVQVE